MKIENNYSPNFKAKFIDKIDVTKIKDIHYKNTDLSLAKITRLDESDIKVLEEIAKWENDKYAWHIYKHAKEGIDSDIYVSTSQTENFEKLDSGKILGVAQITKNHILGAFLDYFQIKPDLKNKGLGSSFMNSIQKIYNKISLMPAQDENVIKFYEKNGFYEYPEKSNFYMWYRDIFERF